MATLTPSLPCAVATVCCALALGLCPRPAAGQPAPCGLGNAVHTCFDQNSSVAGVAVTDDAEPGESFGAALVFGDFDGDGHDDLAIGVPGEEDAVGAVHVLYGSGLGLGLARQQFFSQNNVGGGSDGDAEDGDAFGFALAAGDFDGDGFDDLAVGSPFEDYTDPSPGGCGFGGNCTDAGLIHVIPGAANGLQPGAASVLFGEDIDQASDGDHFGFALLAARAGIDGSDEFDDLFVGAPGDFIGNCCGGDSGSVVLIPGSPNGLNVSSARRLERSERSATEDRAGETLAFGRSLLLLDHGALATGVVLGEGTNGSSDAGFLELTLLSPFPQSPFPLEQQEIGGAGNGSDDRFGAGLAVGDFDGDSKDDVAAGAPGKAHGPGDPNDSGRVYVAFGPVSAGEQDRFQILGENSIPGQTSEADERFGAALVAADLDGDGDDDLVAGAPEEGSGDVGALFVLDGGPDGLAPRPGSPGRFLQTALGGASESGDRFGAVLAAGDVDGDGVPEIAIGVPEEDVGSLADAGMVYVTRAFDPRLVFVDGFDSGGAQLWSSRVP